MATEDRKDVIKLDSEDILIWSNHTGTTGHKNYHLVLYTSQLFPPSLPMVIWRTFIEVCLVGWYYLVLADSKREDVVKLQCQPC